MKNKFSEQLIQMAALDESVREKLLKENKLIGGYHPEMEYVHRQNADELKSVINEIGFPTISKVGEEAAEAAWLIVQHSIGEPEFMKDSYKQMLESRIDVNPANLAFLFDRIQFFQGKPQKYGTQLNADGSIYPVMDTDQLNALRQEHNLPPLPQDKISSILPSDKIEELENQNPDYVLWRKNAGWK
ncbi:MULTISPECIES: DUF6624 domain-containing protein [Chryseobacterium]|uniref:Uncharacterized protein n=1 Tax=Chryseobacterium camelliae TaxID=1265445 RepID=A0ABU0TFD5_9FLAO|nr:MULTISPECIES: DUF6624 domain-containing protein [Chryseobacterium]MDT3406666.1 hypothetical protein [Pseudacidovorax intermedius]MDQ1095536.1 hypothetical protein [Chryseobacterium camelliae]MDQ1099474.1 hypothetical protein [Chryseobacterium sp. SORGH_AS_1048]MDR6086819.1 hypothetical protein [Chryseobacterium sp. SORGH_AS_0909]MDR6131192.1 hypothetical protein [Chryseobacterium sp. SORGH_AS_1175]